MRRWSIAETRFIGWRCVGWVGARMRRTCIRRSFSRLLRDTTDFRDDEHLKAWLLRVTVNCCNDLCRSAWFKRTAPLEAVPDAAAPVHDGHDELWQAVRALPDDFAYRCLAALR